MLFRGTPRIQTTRPVDGKFLVRGPHMYTDSWPQETDYKQQTAVYKPAGHKGAKDTSLQDTRHIGYMMQTRADASQPCGPSTEGPADIYIYIYVYIYTYDYL